MIDYVMTIKKKQYDPFNTTLLESTKKKLIAAQEKYLFARGWIKIGEKHYSPTSRVSWVHEGDKVFLKNALKAQEDKEA